MVDLAQPVLQQLVAIALAGAGGAAARLPGTARRDRARVWSIAAGQVDLAAQQLVVIELAGAEGAAARLPGAALQESGVGVVIRGRPGAAGPAAAGGNRAGRRRWRGRTPP